MIGATILHYKIIKKLGEGGMGIVYKARDNKLDRDVALKFLPSHLASSEPERARLFQEARAAAALNHSNVAHIYAIEEVDEQKFIVMEYVEGTELKERISKGPLPIDEATRIALQICDGLQAAHDRGIIHRDVKSANIMLTETGRVKIMDFGLAKMRGGAQVTMVGSTVGTAACMSPEQARGDEVDQRTDIWSFGVVLYEMLAGRLPFASDYEQAVIYSVLNESPEPLSKIRPDLPQGYSDVVTKALEKTPEERYSSAREIGDAVRLIADGSAQTVVSEVARKPKLKVISIAKIVVPALLVAGAVAWFLLRGGADTVDSLAVLPFENVGGDENMEYLSDGITESLINSLSQLPQLKVMSRSSVFRFKGDKTDPASLGKKLGVRAVLLGRVLQRKNDLSISAELIDVADNSHLWGQQYNRKSADILIVQEEITKKISGNLRLRLADKDSERLARRPTENTEAYQLYLKGRYYWNKRTAADLQKATDYFSQAIQADPGYAQAYSGLADAYLILGVYSDLTPSESFPRAEAAAHRALDIDPTLAEAHATLGDVNIHHTWDWAAAGKELERAIELNPQYPVAHHWYSEYLTLVRRHDEAIAQTLMARDLDPLSATINTWVGWNYYCAGRYDSALVEYRKAINIDPGFPWAHYWMGKCYLQMGLTDDAVATLEKAAQLYDHQTILATLALCYARAGKRSKAEAILVQLTDLAKHRYVTSYAFAVISLGLGSKDETLALLEKAYQERSGDLHLTGVDPMWNSLRSERRFIELVNKIGLPG